MFYEAGKIKVILPCFFRKQALPTIFDYRPKYGIYEEQILTDNETTGLEDWFAVNITDLY